MTTEPEHDPGYLALTRHLYWEDEAGARTQVGTKHVREQMLEFVARVRTDERLAIPLAEPHLAASTPWKRKAKYVMFRAFRFGTRRYDRLAGDSAELMVALAERVILLEREIESLREHLDRIERERDGGSE